MEDLLKSKFTKANYQRFRWQTENKCIKQQEQALLEDVRLEVKSPEYKILEIGCGEGANLINLHGLLGDGYSSQLYGLDLYNNQCWQGLRRRYNFNFLCGNGNNLPFKSRVFDIVFFKDVLHHLRAQEESIFLQELSRVVKTNGKIILIEANGENFIMKLFSLVDRTEQRLRDISIRYIKDLLSTFSNLKIEKLTQKEETAFFRVLLHYQFGCPSLAKYPHLISLIGKIVLKLRITFRCRQKSYLVGIIRQLL